MSDEMEEIITEFITEAEESLERIEPLFVELEQKGQDKELLNDIFRSIHTIKGAAGFLGFQSIVDVAHASENILKKLRDGEITLSRDLIDVILKSVDMLRLLIFHLKEKDGVEEDVSFLVKELEDALNNALGKDKTESSIQSDIEKPQEAQRKDKIQLDETKQKEETIKNKQQNNIHKLTDSFSQNLRVDVERIDKVMDLAGEIVLVRNRLLNVSGYLEQKYGDDPHLEHLMETVSFLDRVTSDLQLAVMKIRMQPIKKVLTKFPRLVRDMSAMVHKEVELEIYGEDTEVDKTVIENIGDPLTHILRNSIDHGIESAQERIAKGKSEKGKVTINTYQKGNQIVIEISDDGRGMDIEKLKNKAIQKGLITEEDASKMSDKAAIDLIFMPGFSTKETTTELSGRGVGMDVVKTNIAQLNGYVEVFTKKDKGTTFKICIPLTLAIIQALMVEISGNKFAIPLSPIEETLSVSGGEINSVSGQDVIVIRDRVCPLISLNKILFSGSNGHGSSEYRYLIVISLGERRFCLAVDRLIGQEEVVIKNLNGIDTSSSYVLGATITGDGKVVFILDVAAIARNFVTVSN